MVPMIDSATEARELVDATRYPPEGSRGIASGRAAEYGDQFTEYVENANGSFTTIAQIESRKGLRNVEEIAAVEGSTRCSSARQISPGRSAYSARRSRRNSLTRWIGSSRPRLPPTSPSGR